jgi:hypothetical protein
MVMGSWPDRREGRDGLMMGSVRVYRTLKSLAVLMTLACISFLPVRAADVQSAVSLLSKSSVTILANDIVSTEYVSVFRLTGERKEITLIFSGGDNQSSSIAGMKQTDFDDKSGMMPLEIGCCGASASQKYLVEIEGNSIPYSGMNFSESGMAWSSNVDLITLKAGKGIVKVKRSVILKPYIEGFPGSIAFGVGDRAGTGNLTRENGQYAIDGYSPFSRIETLSRFSIRDAGIFTVDFDNRDDLEYSATTAGRVKSIGKSSWFMKDDGRIDVRWKSATDKAFSVSSFSQDGWMRSAGPSIEEMNISNFARPFSEAVIVDLKNDVGYRLLYFALSEPMKSSYKKETLELLRNTIMAYYGHQFSRKEYAQFFSQFFWYMPEKNGSRENKIPDTIKARINHIEELEKRK